MENEEKRGRRREKWRGKVTDGKEEKERKEKRKRREK